MQNKLPQFEPNQVLNSEHLNLMVEYLEEQTRLTRNHIMGNGIVSGLGVKRSGNTVTITEGVGVTSAGYLLIVQTNKLETGTEIIPKGTDYNKKRKFNPKFLLFPYKGDTSSTYNTYDLFNNLGDIWQLVETAVKDDIDPANVKMLTPAELDNKVVVLFLQIQVKELKSCEADNCMELGKQWNYSVIPLLMTKTDADTLLLNENKLIVQSPPGSPPTSPPEFSGGFDLDVLANPSYNLPDIVLARPDLTNLTDDISLIQLSEKYKAVILSMINQLSENQKESKIDASIKLILKENFLLQPIKGFTEKLKSILLKEPEYYQYAYDYTRDFVEAYTELQNAAVEYASYEMPSVTSFPHHLRLGTMPTEGGIINSNIYPPSAYRHGFVSSRVLEQQQEKYVNVVYLYNRLISLTSNLSISAKLNDVRITPSNDKQSLCSKAIPFYYIINRAEEWNKFLSYWNPLLYRQNKSRRILSYFDNYNTSDRTRFSQDPGVDGLLHKPLLMLHDDKNFYRIEGHIGASYIEMFETINNYIINYNLPFDLQLVRLNVATEIKISDKKVLINDLESMHNVVKEEVKCLLTTGLNYFSNIRLTKSTGKPEPPAVSTADSNLISATMARASNLGTARALAATSPTIAASPSSIRLRESRSFAFLSSGATRNQSSPIFKTETVEYKVADYGVTDSLAGLSSKFGNQITDTAIANVIVSGGIGLATKTTPAAAYITRIISASKELLKALDVPLEDLDITDYESKLNSLEAETRSFILFAKTFADAILKTESNIVKGELLDYLDRILFECDFQKISAIYDEKARREQLLGIGNHLKQFIALNPGIEHKAGVSKGGTFILVLDEGGSVVADFSLPYRCCAGSGGTQFVLGVLKTLLFAGQVIDIQNVPIPGATVTLNGEPLGLDATAHFRKAVPPNSFLVINVMAEGFEQKNISITAGEDDIVQNFTLFTKEQELKTNFTITVVDPSGAPMANASVTLNDAPLAIDTTTSSFTGQIKANSNFTLNVSLAGFKTYTEAFTTTTDPKVINVKMIKLVSLKGSIVGPDGQPVINATVLLNGALTKTTNNIFEIKDLEGNTTYNLTIEAEGLEKYAETISPNNIDVDKVFTMATATKLTVKVGVFIPSDINFGVEPGQRISIRRGEINPGGGARVPDELAAGKSELLTNEGVSSKVDSVVQNYDDKLHLFSSDEKKANHTLIVEIKQLRLTLTAPLTVEDKDILVLIPAKQRYKVEGVFSFIIQTGFEDVNLITCNTFMASYFNLPTGTKIMNRSFEIRFYTSADANAFGNLLIAAGVKFINVSSI